MIQLGKGPNLYLEYVTIKKKCSFDENDKSPFILISTVIKVFFVYTHIYKSKQNILKILFKQWY